MPAHAAAPRSRTASMPDHEIVLLAALIADGNLTAAHAALLLRRRLTGAAGRSSRRPSDDRRCACTTAERRAPRRISAGRGGRAEPVTELLRAARPLGPGARRQVRSGAIFGLGRRPDRSLPLGAIRLRRPRLCVRPAIARSATRRSASGSHATSSTCCCGSASSRRSGRCTARSTRGPDKVAREVLVTGQDGLDAFADSSRSSARPRGSRASRSTGRPRRVEDERRHLPVDGLGRVLDAKGDRSWADVSEAAGHPRNHNWHVGTGGAVAPVSSASSRRPSAAPRARRSSRRRTSGGTRSRRSSTSATRRPTTSTVPGDHNFVADDIIVHNSALIANFAENAALEAKKAVALFSLEMSESELAQRFIASQASIKGDDLRKGRVADSRWPKILEASNRLAESPLYIDDSSDLVGARRPREGAPAAQQHADGLGLILIDYLQLMRATGQRRQPRRADRADLPRAEDARARARGPGHRAVAAQPRRRAAHRQAPDAVRPARVRLDRAGRRPRHVHLPRRVLRRASPSARGSRTSSSPSTATAASATSS